MLGYIYTAVLIIVTIEDGNGYFLLAIMMYKFSFSLIQIVCMFMFITPIESNFLLYLKKIATLFMVRYFLFSNI